LTDEFYVGYQPRAPKQLAHWTRRAVPALFLFFAAAALVFVNAQAPFEQSKFEFQQFRSYEGDIVAWPHPMLLTKDARFLLVAPGKHGASELVAGAEGKRVRLQGALIQRSDQQMLELRLGTLKILTTSSVLPQSSIRDLGRVALTGEIVDSKCFLGVMNPGNGKVHRDCAVRCISGGIPPAFLVRDASGESRLLLLTSQPPDFNRQILSYVAEPVTITGRLLQSGSTLILETDPKDFHRE
jgi:hypothetical protein